MDPESVPLISATEALDKLTRVALLVADLRLFAARSEAKTKTAMCSSADEALKLLNEWRKEIYARAIDGAHQELELRAAEEAFLSAEVQP